MSSYSGVIEVMRGSKLIMKKTAFHVGIWGLGSSVLLPAVTLFPLVPRLSDCISLFLISGPSLPIVPEVRL